MDEEEEEIPQLIDYSHYVEKRIPVTLLTGYLGSGKTTLLNYLLKENHGKRIAIIENEFSNGLGIEGMIARSGVNENSLNGFFELTNGCICCTVKDNLVLTLEQLILHADKFDYILIETTGIANPGPIISVLWSDDESDCKIKLDGVVTVVDCVNILTYLQNETTRNDVIAQIAYADRILLNKQDLITSEKSLEVERAIKYINSSAELIKTTYSQLNPDMVLGINAFVITDEVIARIQDHDLKSSQSFELCGLSKTDDGTSNRVVLHGAGVLSTISLEFSGDLNLTKLKRALDELLFSTSFSHITATDDRSEVATQIYRLKALVCIQDSPFIHLVQGVHDIFDIQPTTQIKTSQSSNKIVAIGICENVQVLNKCLMNCLCHV